MRDLCAVLLLVTLPLHCMTSSDPELSLPVGLRVENPGPTVPPGDAFDVRESHPAAWLPRVAVAVLLGMLFAGSIVTWAGCWYRRNQSQNREVEAAADAVQG